MYTFSRVSFRITQIIVLKNTWTNYISNGNYICNLCTGKDYILSTTLNTKPIKVKI